MKVEIAFDAEAKTFSWTPSEAVPLPLAEMFLIVLRESVLAARAKRKESFHRVKPTDEDELRGRLDVFLETYRNMLPTEEAARLVERDIRGLLAVHPEIFSLVDDDPRWGRIAQRFWPVIRERYRNA